MKYHIHTDVRFPVLQGSHYIYYSFSWYFSSQSAAAEKLKLVNFLSGTGDNTSLL